METATHHMPVPEMSHYGVPDALDRHFTGHELDVVVYGDSSGAVTAAIALVSVGHDRKGASTFPSSFAPALSALALALLGR